MLSSWSPASSLAANRPCERHHLDPPRPRRAQSRRGGIRGRAGRVHVVDEADAPRGRRGAERAPDVPPALGERETALAREPAGAVERRRDGKLPAAGELACEPLRGVVAATAAPGAVRWD